MSTKTSQLTPHYRVWRQILSTFEKWLSLPNYDTVEVVAATVLANQLPGEPVFLSLVGPSSSGKTEIVRALELVQGRWPRDPSSPFIHFVDGLTPHTLLSGYKPTDRKSKDTLPAKYGLLVPHNMDRLPFIITMKDFSSVLEMRPENRAEVLAQLRSVFDGKMVRDFGNGQSVGWEGKAGLIVCSTGAYDQEMSQHGVFGDRPIIYRCEAGDAVGVAEKAGRNSSNSSQMRVELQKAMKKLDTLSFPEGELELSLEIRTFISKLCAFVAVARTPVKRDRWFRQVVDVPQVEGTGRMSTELHQLLRGMLVLKQIPEPGEDEATLIEKVAFSTIPSVRMTVIANMYQTRPNHATEIQDRTQLPKSVLDRTLQDMGILGLISWTPDIGQSQRGSWYVEQRWAEFFHRVEVVFRRG